jgi:hypothetical protein
MKKFSPQELDILGLEGYLTLIASELNKAGFREHHKFNGQVEEYSYTPDDFMLDGAIINDISALNYLKEIGVLNNGKCPRCGKSIPNNNYTFTNYKNLNASYAICFDCHDNGVRFQKKVNSAIVVESDKLTSKNLTTKFFEIDNRYTGGCLVPGLIIFSLMLLIYIVGQIFG